MESSPGAMSAAVTVSDVVTDTQTGVLCCEPQGKPQGKS